MSRKSARLQCKDRSTETLEKCGTVSRKRKAEEDPEGTMAVNKRRQQFRIENQWVPISQDSSVATCSIIPSRDMTPPDEKYSSSDLALGAQFRFKNYFTTPITSRCSPLPKFNWADSTEVWQLMLKKEVMYTRDTNMFDKHPCLQSRMRAILLDWLIEVCEVYRLHRETFFLATDFLDRFLSTQRNIMKHQLQLLGVTSLFIAAKLEEIYPPKLAEFAYVTDGACTEDEILVQELVILKALKWDLSPMTSNNWLNVYLQVANVEQIVETEHGFFFPQYSSHAFIQIARLLDLCILDVGCLQYTYSILAAAALYHLSTREAALAVSGLEWKDIVPCVQWMAPFAVTIRESGTAELKFFPNVPAEDSHNIQTHTVDLGLLEKAQERQQEILTADRSSPDLQAQIITQLTPPQSDKKPIIIEQIVAAMAEFE